MVSTKPAFSRNERPMKVALHSLTQAWAVFYETFLNPSVLILFVAAIALIFLPERAGAEELPKGLRVLFTIIVSVLASVIGALAWKKWSETAESGVLVTRGKSAVRGLNLLLQSLAAAEARIIQFRRSAKGTSEPSIYFLLMCDELQGRIDLLQEATMNAMQEWTDIIPEADVKTQLGLITNLKKQKAALEVEVETLSAKSKEPEQEGLIAKLKEKEEELEQVQKMLSQRESDITSSVLSGLTRKPILDLLGDLHSRSPDFQFSAAFEVCPHCHKQFPEGQLQDAGECPNCNETLDGTPPISMTYQGMLFDLEIPNKPKVVSPANKPKNEANQH